MVKVAAFKGITYNPDKIKQLDDVMSPPYDIISTKMQEELYQKNQYNFIRLILGKQFQSDTAQDNRYTRAKHFFETWRAEDILHSDTNETIYPYQVTYTINDEEKTMNGFFILLQLDTEYKQVKAHEKTLSKPKADRLDLLRACKANLEPIQLLYIDEEDSIQKEIKKTLDETPLIQVTGYDSFTHALWKLTDQNTITKIKEILHDNILFIADGHHRYQTAINYAQEQKEQSQDTNPEAPYNYRMVILVNMFDKGLAILPTHRLISLPSINESDLIKKIEEFFIVETIPRSSNKQSYTKEAESIKQQLQTTKEHKFALIFKDHYYILTLKEKDIMDELAKERSKTWKELDVSILHKIIIEQILGISSKTLEDHVKYTRVDEDALDHVDKKECTCSIIMNPTKITELQKVAEASEHMPQKSTYFLPKMLSGLVMYAME